MKINEASVIDNKVIDYAIRTLIADGNHVLAQELKSQLKPLDPIVRDALSWANMPYAEIDDQYINETEI